MKFRTNIATAVVAIALATAAGCAVHRGQESVGAYIDDTTITTSVKARFVDSRAVDASSIRVETMHGVVLLSGFAKSNDERLAAATIARKVDGVNSVKNEIEVHTP